MHCEQEHGSGLFLQVLNPFLPHAILKMSIDTTITQALLVVFSGLYESIVCESAIVGVVVEDLDSKVSGKVFKGLFCQDGFSTHEPFLEKYKRKFGELVLKNSGIIIPLCHK